MRSLIEDGHIPSWKCDLCVAPDPRRLVTAKTMANYTDVSSTEIFFLADTHFRDPDLPGEIERRRRFAGFLAGLEVGSTLFLLGDIFDFYFEYQSFVLKRYFDVFAALHEAAGRGVHLHFLGGNHDYWVGSFLRDEVGIKLHSGDNIFIHAQGRKIWCAHGDLTLPDDRNYQKIRDFLRHPFIIRLASLLHPDLMNAIATRVSRRTKKRKRRTQEEMANHLGSVAAGRFFQNSNDAFIMGHVHYPFHRVYDGKDFMIVGDWIGNYTYGKLSSGRLTVEKAESPA